MTHTEADRRGPGGGGRDHRDDGCFVRLLGPAAVVATLVALVRRSR